jgi:hypothetical protein
MGPYRASQLVSRGDGVSGPQHRDPARYSWIFTYNYDLSSGGRPGG